MGLGFNIRNAKVVLIATYQYTDANVLKRDESLPNRPNVKHNVDRFKDVLLKTMRDENGHGLDESQIITLYNKSSPSEITQAVEQVAKDKNLEFLLVLYSGHGVVSKGNESELLLTLNSSTLLSADNPNHKGNWLASRNLLNVVQTARNKTKKLVILDCCFSGLATANPNFKGEMCLITSCEYNKKSNEEAFLPVLCEKWEQGFHGKAFLSLDDILDQLPKRLLSNQEWRRISSDGLHSFNIARRPLVIPNYNSESIGLEFFKNTNRDNELTALEKLTAVKGRIKIGILRGEAHDKSLSLVDRFITTESGGVNFMPFKVDPEGVRHLETIKLTSNIDQYTFNRNLSAYFGKKNEDLTKDKILRYFRQKYIVVNLEVYWGKNTESLLSDFLNSFWGNSVPEDRHIFVFIHLIYTEENPPRKKMLDRWLTKKKIWDQDSIDKKLKAMHEVRQAYCQLLPRLRPIYGHVVLSMLDQHLKSEDIKELDAFMKDEMYTMASIEHQLRPFTKRYR